MVLLFFLWGENAKIQIYAVKKQHIMLFFLIIYVVFIIISI